MTDQAIPDVTDEERMLARKWAESIESATNSVDLTANPWSERARAAARVILDTVPAPVPPTLADMTPEERAACRWMQCDVKNHRERYVIATPDDNDGEVALIDADGGIDWIFPEYVTPRPDLPRLTWPGTEKPAPALPDGWRLADHPDHGRVIVTNSTPNQRGNVCFVFPSDDLVGHDWIFCRPDELTYIDQETDQ